MSLARLSVVFAVVAIAMAVGISAFMFWRDGPPGGGGGTALIGGPFTLLDQHGRTVTEADLRDHVSLVYFGYTFCPDVCPTELLNISVAVNELGPRAAEVTPIFITVDPARDTVEAMAAYVGHFHPSLVGLTGSEAQVARAAKAYKVYYAKVADDSASDYLMDHSSYVYLMDREGRYLSHFGPGTPPEIMASRIRKFLDGGG